MFSEESIFSTDLAGIIVGETAISDVQGEVGLLSYRGIDINEMVGVPFLHVVWMVLFGRMADRTAKKSTESIYVPPLSPQPHGNRSTETDSHGDSPHADAAGASPTADTSRRRNARDRPGC